MELFAQLLVNGLIAGSIYALLALGFNFIYSTTKFFNIAHGSICVIGAYAALVVAKNFDLPLWMAIITGIVISALTGYLIDLLVFSRLRHKKASSMILLVSSLGVFIVLQSILGIFFTNRFKTITDITKSVSLELYGLHFSQLHIYIFITCIFISIFLILIYNKTKFGKAVKAVSDDIEVAKIVGINTEKIISKVFIVGSAIAGLGGILYALDTGIQPTSDMHLLLMAVIAAIIGGVGNVYGALAGAFLLGIVENLGVWLIPTEWKSAISFGLLILFLLFRPKGIFKR
jgi:branched-subunit amino acid ABC-type transport system permease component